MENGDRSTQIVRFGVFEADLKSGELHKNGARVALQGQPFQVCAILLEHPGELITREELRQRVWPEDTFVDFDQALSAAVAKVRIALGDEATNPRFVETLPRRGYRFIAPVDKPPSQSPSPGAVKGSIEEQRAGSRWIFVGLAVLAKPYKHTSSAHRNNAAGRFARCSARPGVFTRWKPSRLCAQGHGELWDLHDDGRGREISALDQRL